MSGPSLLAESTDSMIMSLIMYKYGIDVVEIRGVPCVSYNIDHLVQGACIVGRPYRADSCINGTIIPSIGAKRHCLCIMQFLNNGLLHIVCNSFLFSHYDLNELWTKHRPFAVEVFVMVVETMPKLDRYKAMQALVSHLDAIRDNSLEVKLGILDTLSQCVAAAADGSLGKIYSNPVSSV